MYSRAIKSAAVVVAGLCLVQAARTFDAHVDFGRAFMALRAKAPVAVIYNYRAYQKQPWDFRIRQQFATLVLTFVVRRKAVVSASASKRLCEISLTATQAPVVRLACDLLTKGYKVRM